MSWLLFLDESGHDHKNMPFEVHGGVAIHAQHLWRLLQDCRRLELDAFGEELSHFRKEIKGSSLLDRDRFRWASQGARMPDEERRRLCRSFLAKGLEKKAPSREEFTAYGQACLEWVRGLFESLVSREAFLFAALIPRGVGRPEVPSYEEILRKDQVFLFERYFYFLEARQEHGLIVVDEVEKSWDRKFMRRIENYFSKTQVGRHRSRWIVPTPFVVASDMAYPIQIADVCIYCVNWGFRQVGEESSGERPEIRSEFWPWLNQLQFRGEGYRDGQTYRSSGFVFVPDPYTSRRQAQKKEITPLDPPESRS
jgi:Protein of unknown function (DUF3800)